MLEKLKKNIKRSTIILDTSGFVLAGLSIAAMFIFKEIEYQYLMMIPLFISMLLIFLFFNLSSKNIVSDIDYDGDKITFLSSLFHNYLFVNDEMVLKKFAVVNFINHMNVDYKGHELKVSYKNVKAQRGRNRSVTFYLDGEFMMDGGKL